LALGKVEGGDGESKQDEQAADAKGQALAGEVVEDADEPTRLEAPKKGGIGAPPVLEADPSAIKARIDARIDREPINKLAPAIALQEVPHFAPPFGASAPEAGLSCPTAARMGHRFSKLHPD